MKNQFLFVLLLVASIFPVFAQDIEVVVYKGTMEGGKPITLYIESQENACNADLLYAGMYKYDGISTWIQVQISDKKDSQFIMVEYGFTGVLILNKEKDNFNGLWISPDTKEQLKIELHKIELSKEMKKFYENKFEKVNHANYDC